MLARAVLPIRSICRCDCNGRHICRPYKPTRNIVIAINPRAGRAPPLPQKDFYCLVGRGDPTPPGKLPIAAKLHGTVKTVPYKQPEGKRL